MTGYKRVEPQLPVANIGASIDFYCSRLGFTVDVEPTSAVVDFAIISRHAVAIQLVAQGVHHPPGHFTIWIDVTDAITEHQRLQPQVDIEWGPEDYDYGRREFTILLPDRHRIILSQAIDT